MTAERAVCIHGHFYQPPRENPWLEAIEPQDSAYPYHDWNERINAECYAANTASRILNGRGHIEQIVNNYAKISFNMGPTLLSWLEQNATQVYEAILWADRESQRSFSGHGSAIAQAYSHMILPLANLPDKRTQVRWGVRDFEHRFGRQPEGMWLPETAVDIETLGVLASQGIRFTILAPHQALRVRSEGGRDWHDVAGGRVDTTMPYVVHLPSGGTLAVFFYDQAIAQDVSFGRLLDSGDNFLQRLLGGFSGRADRPQLVHIATDGEVYGHHHRFGDMALAYVLDQLGRRSQIRVTNYAEALERHPPTHEVAILEGSSWSCPHGVERWRSNCGCSSGKHPGWNQEWRAPLRQAMDWLRDVLVSQYVARGQALLADPWSTRDNYVDVILKRTREGTDGFLQAHASHPLTPAERVEALKLLEMQRHAMLMYTSCGWFFDDLAGLETVQILQYAGRAMQLAEGLFGPGSEAGFLAILERAQSNVPENGNGRRIFEHFVRPAVADLPKMLAHRALVSEGEPEQTGTLF